MNTDLTDTEQIQFLNKLVSSESEIISSAYYEMNAENKQRSLKILLQYNICEVRFKKIDGSIRTMPCTLRRDKLPVQESILESSEPKRTKANNPNVLSVYCLDRQEWRSFRLDNVISVKLLQN